MSHPHDPVAICELYGVKFEYLHPPIPDRNFDWTAWFDAYEEDGSLEFGRTKAGCAWSVLWNIQDHRESLADHNLTETEDFYINRGD